jgi:uncharacterized secreted protein with C-terminal beta-propeller domain
MNANHSTRFSAAIALLVPAMLLAGCPGTGTGDGSDAERAAGGKLVAFRSADDWVSYFRRQVRRNIGGGLRDYLSPAGGGTTTGTAAPAAEDASGGEGGGNQDSFSTTNVQEAGVDEADIVKSDGTNFYIAKGNSLRIVRANPRTDMAEIGELDFDEQITAMYLLDGRVITLSQTYEAFDGYAIALIWPPYYSGGKTVVREINVTDPANPTEISKVELDGSLVNSRVTGGRLIAVLSIAPKLPANLTPLAVDTIDMADVMPQVRNAAGTSDLVPWDHWLYPESPDGYLMTAVVTLDAADIQNTLGTVAVLAQAGTIYATTEALYLTDTDWDFLGTGRETTTIHKFAFDEQGVAQYMASGDTPGRLLNQFSLGEHEGVLRVAMHIPADFGNVVFAGGGNAGGGIEPAIDAGPAQASNTPPQPSNAVYVLAQNGGALDIVGRVENIAPGERLYAARFLQERGFLVTFQQIDPLFALDLRDPAAPAIVGELHIPGFSDYLHPLDDTHLIGLGRATTQTPWGGVVPTATQLSLFDVSDLSNPTLVEQFAIGGYGSSSDANYDHKAFAFLPERGLLAIPAMTWPQDYDPIHNQYFAYVPPDFEGVLCYSVDATGFTLLGRVASVLPPDPYNYGYYGGWKRPAFIGDTVYAINDQGARAAPLNDFSATTQVMLAPGESPDPYYGEGDSVPPEAGRGE